MPHKIVPDSKYPNMYRIVLPDGRLSDMLNLSRAKDTAARFEHIAPAPPPPLITGPRIDITISPCLKKAMMGGGKVHRDEFNTYLGDRLLCSSSRTPFVDAARALIAAGHDPEATLVMRHRGSNHDALWAKLGYAATLTVSGSQFALFRGELSTAPQKPRRVRRRPI